MATKVKPSRLQVSGTPQVGQVPVYVDEDTFQWGAGGGGGTGDVSGPASSTDGDIVLFDGATGKLIKDSGVGLSSKLDATALSNNAYGGGWNGDTTHTPTKDALYDKIHTMDVEIGNKAADTSVVKLTGNQTIAGTKTFSTSPVVPSKTTDATNSGTAIATEAQVYKKQDKLTTQTAYTSKGTATKVPTITTNTLGQVTSISETDIAFPVTSVNGSTGAVTVNDVKKSATAPSSPTEGMVWYDTSRDLLKYYEDLGHGDASWITVQEKLASQTAYTSKGTASKVPQITTNSLGQVTGITEVSISYPSQVNNTAYGSSWDGVTTTAPSKNAVYDKISAMDTTISGKQDTLVNQTNIKSINGNSLLGSGDLTIQAGVTSVNGQTGTVVLDADDISDSSTTNKFVTQADKDSWDSKQDELESGVNIRTINGTSILGSGNIDTPTGIPSQTGEAGKFLTTDGTSVSWGAVAGIQVDSASPIQLTKIWAGTQAQYDALGSYDATTVYLTI